MKSPGFALCLLLLFALSVPSLEAQDTFTSPTTETVARPVIDLSAPEAVPRAKPSHDLVTVGRAESGTGITVSVKPGPASFPGVGFSPAEGAAFDLSGTGYIEVRLVNTGSQIISATLRVDNPGGKASCAGAVYLKPGASGTARAYFASPRKGAGAVDPANVAWILLFVGKNEKDARSFRIESLTAGGTPGAQAPGNPDLVRTKPPGGVMFSPSGSFDAEKQLLPRAGAQAKVDAGGKSVEVAFTGKPGQNVLLRPKQGFWDLGDYLQVTVRVKNTGSAPAAVSAQLISRGGVSDVGAPEKPIAPGTTADLVIPFIPHAPFEVLSDPQQEVLEFKKGWGVKETAGARFTSHQTNGLLLLPSEDGKPSAFEIVAVTAGMPPSKPAPAWLGQRPPAAGEWVKTFEDNFDGTALNTAVWNTYADNWWDKRVGFSKDNVLLGGGFARLRIEKRAGFHNDDPNGRATEFATGWLDSYGKWTQRYGYYEVRVKLPTVPSMFPAFWLMPDRGHKAGPKQDRTNTKAGGMEFDVFEGQSMWGPYRTTFGAHFDHYGAYHKTAGSHQYNQPDAEGFLTIGMLWLPGHISVYSMGQKRGSWDSPRVGSVQSYVIFDMLPGGFEYDPLDPATLPADLVIDYVRVWQRKDLASPEDGSKQGL